MADWTRPFTATYRFMRVSRSTGYETAQLDGITGGTLQVNQDTATFESATLGTAAYFDLGADLVRGYLDATWEDGTEESVCLGTWLATIPGRNVDGATETCTAYCDGRLQELQDDSFSAPIVVDAGENIVATAQAIAEGAGLTVVATPSADTLGTAWAFGLSSESDGDGGSKLDAVNALLKLAGYGSASTDELGRVVMKPYTDPSSRTPVWTFEEGINATFLAEAEEERDSREVANVVLAIYESDDSTTIGEAVDDDPQSPYSTVRLGRRKFAKYSYNSMATQTAADAKAAELLRTNQSTIRRVKLRHVHCPARVGDVVAVSWPSAGISGSYVVRTQTIDIGSAGCLTASELRAFERRYDG